MPDSLRQLIHRRASLLFWGALLFVLASLAAVYVIDVLGAWEIRDRHYAHREYPFFWYYWFDRPVENPLQWLLLGATVLTCAYNTRSHYTDNEPVTDPTRFWGLMTVGTTLMLLEDALNIRHVIHGLIAGLTDHESYGVLTTLVELVYFGALGAVLLVAFIKYRHVFWPHAKTRNYLTAGFVFYAIAVASSWLGSAFSSLFGGNNLYTAAGPLVLSPFMTAREATTELHIETNQYLAENGVLPLEFWFMDRVWEESIELLGAAALLVAALTAATALSPDNRS